MNLKCRAVGGNDDFFFFTHKTEGKNVRYVYHLHWWYNKEEKKTFEQSVLYKYVYETRLCDRTVRCKWQKLWQMKWQQKNI